MALPVLLVPVVTELEWGIADALRESTEVAAYDAPGVGDEPPPDRFDRRAIADRGLREIADRGWERCVVAADEFATLTAALIASLAPEHVAGLALGHPTLTFRTAGPEPPLNGEVLEAFVSMEKTNYRAYARALSQVTQGSYDEDFVDTYISRVPQGVLLAYDSINHDEGQRLDELLKDWEGELLLAEHHPCLIWNREAFRDAKAAFPSAGTLACEAKPSVSPDFAEALRGFCESLEG